MAEQAAVLIGPGAKMAGALAQGGGARAAGEYNAQVKEYQAQSSLLQAAEDERRLRVQARGKIAETRATIGASGITAEGSALDVLAASASNAALDALTVRHQGQMKAWAYRAGAASDLFEGKLAYEAGQIGAASALFGAGTDLVKAAGTGGAA